MTIARFLHLSDLHYGSKTTLDAAVVIEALMEDVRIQIGSGELVDAIIISGDLANSADDDAQLEDAFKKFVLPLADAAQVPLDRVCLCPGNHDISRSIARQQQFLENGLKGMLTSAEAINRFFDSRADSSEFGDALRRSDAFARVAGKYLPHWKDAGLSAIQRFDLRGVSVGVASLNTAWRATGEADDADFGKLIMGERVLDEAIALIEDCTLKIAVHHHPIDWLQPADRDAIKPRLARCFDLSCVGHLHEALPSAQQSPYGSLVTSQAPSVYQGRSRTNGYHIISIDTSNWSYNFKIRQYVDKRRQFDIGIDAAPGGEITLYTVTQKNGHCTQSELFLRNKRDEIQAIIENHLDMADLRSEGCRPTDLFVPPVLSKRVSEPGAEEERRLRTTDVEVDNIVSTDENIVIVGPRQAGKTSLALYLVERIASGDGAEQRIPVYADLKHLALNKYGLKRAIGAFYGTTPEGFNLDKALDEGALTYIVDNFDAQSRELLAKFAKLAEQYPKIRWICLGTPDASSIVKERVFREVLPKFDRLYMQELPRRQIRQLTARWVEHGGLEGDPKEVFRAVMAQLVRGGLPRTPYMVTLLLWALRRRRGSERLNEAVLLGMVVDYLLGKADFRQSRLGALDPTAKEIILQEIAFWLREGGGSLTENALMKNLSEYLERKRSPFAAGDVLEKLVATGLLRRSQASIAFKYECFQEYFIALAFKGDIAQFHKRLTNLEFLDYAREIELMSGLRRTNDDVIVALQEKLEGFAPADFCNTELSDFDTFARRELQFSIDRGRLKEIRETRLSEDQVDEMMDEADRRAVDRGEEKVSESLNRTDGDVAGAVQRRQRQAIEADQQQGSTKVRPGTFVASMELLAKVIKYSEFSDFDNRAPATRFVIDGWVRIFLRMLDELSHMVDAIGSETGETIPKEEKEAILYLIGKYLFGMMATGLNDILASPSSAATASELLTDADIKLGRKLLTLFLLEDANHPEWSKEWGRLLEDASTRGFVVQTFVQRLWEIAHTKALDLDQSAQVEAVVTSIERRLDLTKGQKGAMLQDLRDATTVATYVDVQGKGASDG